ncbi:ribosome recycling factor [Natroniella sulfidigena]|uniref:ribosome recycling factor n=1 Tax=Natroniella sulfidigena TaxID=723921 RepID=UPI00200B3F13|nr:ribosome recycling factor [Natroniella sulfidigena]MCK8816497.1 ribosome recycling factor [Natroniella sulfidigena]
MIAQVAKETKEKMDQVVDKTKREFNKVRTGRARPSLLDGIKAEYYGALTPLNQMAKVSAPEARQLLIKPFDANVIDEIEKAILKSDLGLTPNNDGDVIRINIPQLTEERRKELAQVVNNRAEEGKIAIRNIRREANSDLEELENEGEISEDNYHRGLENIQEITDEYIEKIDQLLEEKNAAIMDV